MVFKGVMASRKNGFLTFLTSHIRPVTLLQVHAHSLAPAPKVAAAGSAPPPLLILVKLKPTAPLAPPLSAALTSRPLLQSCCAILAPALSQVALLPLSALPLQVMPVSFKRLLPWPTQPP